MSEVEADGKSGACLGENPASSGGHLDCKFHNYLLKGI
jgi:hypothetical protein